MQVGVAQKALVDRAAKARTAPVWRLPSDALLLLTLIPVCAFAIAPLARGPMFASADGLFHVYRLVEFDRVFRSGVPYPRWAPDLMAGYGYPIFIFQAPLQYYLAELAHLAGLGYVDAIKFVVGLGMLASLVGMYVLARDLWGPAGGFLSAISYLYAPYRFVNTYLDGELSQTLAWAWLPWLLWACWRFLGILNAECRAPSPGGAAPGASPSGTRHSAPSTAFGLVAAGCTAGLLYTHSLMSWLAFLMLAPLLLGMLPARLTRFSRLAQLCGYLGLGAGLAAPYWLVALLEQPAVQLNRVRTGNYDFHANIVPLARAVSGSPLHEYAGYAGVNGPAQVGLIQGAAAVVGFALLTTAWGKGWLTRPQRALTVLFSGLALGFFLLMLPPGSTFWEHVPFGAYLQFPDRVLAPLALLLALLSGGIAVVLPQPGVRGPGSSVQSPGSLALGALGVGAIGGILIYAAVAKLQPGYIALPSSLGAADAVEYEQQSRTVGTSARAEFTPVAFHEPPVSSPLAAEMLQGREASRIGPPTGAAESLQPISERPEDFTFLASAPHPSAIRLLLAYFPGWSASANSSSVPVSAGPDGLMGVSLPAGRSKVEVRFGGTPDRSLAAGIAAMSLLSLAFLCALKRKASPGRTPRTFTLTFSRRGEGSDHPLSAWTKTSGFALLAAATAGAAVLWHSLPVPASSPAAQPMDVQFDDGLRLLGSDVRQVDSKLQVTTYWQADTEVSAAPTMTLSLATMESPWANASKELPAPAWPVGAIRAIALTIDLPAGTPAGSYELDVELREPNGREIQHRAPRLMYKLPIVGKVRLAPAVVSSPATGFPSGQPPAVGDFGPLRLLAWQAPAHAEQGGFVPFELWWRTSQEISEDLAVYLHVVDNRGRQVAGHDDQPRAGANPTSAWRPGELERDIQWVLLPKDLPPGDYALRAGWYSAATAQPAGPQNVLVGSFTVHRKS